MAKFFNQDDIINITSNEICKLTDKTAFNVVRKILRSSKYTNKWEEISKAVSGSMDCSKAIEDVYNYASVLCQIANQGCGVVVTPEKRNVRNIENLENFYKNIGYKHDETGANWDGPDSADLADAEERYKLAKRSLSTI